LFTFLLLIIIYLSFISLGLPDSLHGCAWPSMYGFFNVPLHYAGFISMIITGASAVSSIFSERVIRRLGTGLVTLVSVLLTACALTGISFSASFIHLCLFAIPLGLGGGAVDASLNNYVALNYKARHMSWLHCFWGVGASIGPIIMSSFLAQNDSWGLGYRTIGIIQFCLVMVIIISLPLWKNNKSAEDIKKNEHIKLKKILSIQGVKEVLTAFFLYCTIEMTTGLWGASYLVTVRNIPPQTAAKWIALFFIGITVGRFISGFVTMKLSNRMMIRLGQIIIGCGIITMILPFEEITVLPGLFMIGLGCAPIFPSLLHQAPESFGKIYSQAIIGMQIGCAYIGTTIMPPLFGWLTSFLNFKIFPVFIGLILIIKIIVVEISNKKIDKTRSLENQNC